MKKSYNKVSLLFLFFVADLGTYLRSLIFLPSSFAIPLEYIHLVHTHSHVAFQGWVYTILFLLLTQIYLTDEKIVKRKYDLQFKLTVFTVVGILISFALQGYKFYSIIFSTLFQILNYWFFYSFFKDTKNIDKKNKKQTKRKLDSLHKVSLRFIKTGLWLGFLSTFFPLGVGVLAAKGFAGTEIYKSVLYTFLHLQYNGWFLFVVMGLFFKLTEKYIAENNAKHNEEKIFYNINHAVIFYRLFALSVFPAIALSLLGMKFSSTVIFVLYVFALLAAVLQTVAIIFLGMFVNKTLKALLNQASFLVKCYVIIFLLSFFAKILLQSLSVFPMFQLYAFHNKSIVLTYLHLTFLGVITFFLLSAQITWHWLDENKFVQFGTLLFILGFFLTEILLLLNGFGLYYNSVMLAAGSGIMACGIFFLLGKVSR